MTCEAVSGASERERESVDCVDNNLLEAKKMKKIPAFVLRTRNNRKNMILMMTTVDVVLCAYVGRYSCCCCISISMMYVMYVMYVIGWYFNYYCFTFLLYRRTIIIISYYSLL